MRKRAMLLASIYLGNLQSYMMSESNRNRINLHDVTIEGYGTGIDAVDTDISAENLNIRKTKIAMKLLDSNLNMRSSKLTEGEIGILVESRIDKMTSRMIDKVATHVLNTIKQYKKVPLDSVKVDPYSVEANASACLRESSVDSKRKRFGALLKKLLEYAEASNTIASLARMALNVLNSVK